MKKFFAKICRKNGIAKRIVSMSLALLMVLSTLQALPVGILVANAAEPGVRVHFDNADNWENVYVHKWGTVSGTVWPGIAITETDTDGWYVCDIGSISGAGDLGLVFHNNTGTQTQNINISHGTEVSEFYISGGQKAGRSTVTSAKPESWTGKLTIYAQGASDLAAYMWKNNGGGDINGSWDKPTIKFTDVAGHDGWSQVVIENLTVEDGMVNFILHGASGQTDDCLFALEPDVDNTIWVTGGINATNDSISHQEPAGWTSNVKSPVVNGNQVTFNYAISQVEGDEVYIRGDVSDWSNGVKFSSYANGVYTHIMTLAPGEYKYKFWDATNGWKGDPLNTNVTNDNDRNSIVYVPGLICKENVTVEKGTDAELPATIAYLGADGSETSKAVTWALKNSSDSSFATVKDGSKLNVNVDSDATTIDLIATATEDNTLTTTVSVKLNEAGTVVVKSPVVNGNQVTFNYVREADFNKDVYLCGDMTSWGDHKVLMTKGDDNIYSVTIELKPGKYEYKFYYDDGSQWGAWPQDPLNLNPNGENSILVVSGLKSVDNVVVEKGTDYDELPATLKYVAEDGAETDKAVTYTLAQNYTGVTFENGVLNVSADSDLTTIKLIATANDDAEITTEITVKLNEAGVEALRSPIVNGTQVTFNYEDTSGNIGLGQLYLRGTITDWDNGKAFTSKENNIHSLTMSVKPGKYSYKFWSEAVGWTDDPLNNDVLDSDNNSILIVPGLYSGSRIEVAKGEDYTLPTSLDYVDAEGKSSKKEVTYALRNQENSSFATLTGNVLNVANGDSTVTAIDLIATATDGSGETGVVTVELVENTFTYTVYVYSPIESRLNANNSALYIWDKANNGTGSDYSFTGTGDINGKTWLKAEIDLSIYQMIGFIFKSKESWDWQTADLIFQNTEKTDRTIYIVDGYDKIYTSVDEIPEVSYLSIEYTRANGDYNNPSVEVWNNGYSYKEGGSTKNFTYNFDNSTGKYVVNIPIALGTKDRNVGFKIYNNGEIDGTDQTVTIKAGEKLTKVKYNNGQLTVVPDSSGYVADRENNKISFYYRDEAKFLANQMHTIGSVKLAVRRAVGDAAVTAEERIDMTYDANDERFELENQDLPNDSDIYYYFVVDGTDVLDAKNSRRTTIEGKEYCMVRNRSYNINLQASVKHSDMTSDDGNVLYLTYTQVDGFNPEKITVDLSSLGLGNKVEMDKELKALSFGCLDGTSVGTKAIKVTLIDDSDMTYTATATVNVKARTKTANTSTKLGTFDWDEAVIYFAVTDRFFDGNTSNNLGDPNSSADDAAFDKNNAGSYHGGDFAGLTAKIDYLYNLGVNTIWITPIVDNVDGDFGTADDGSYYAYHGYWASDFTKLNPHLGNEAEFKALVDAAHAKGMKIMVDVVINHAGYGNDQEDTTTYFNNIINGTMMIRDAANTEAGDIKVATSGLPDFMTEDPVVRQQLIAWQTDWLKYGVDYYRVDTVKHVENTTWNAFKNALVEKDQDFKLIGEYFGAGYSNDYDQLDTGRMDSVLDFDFNDIMLKLVDEDLAGIENALNARNLILTNTATTGSFTSSHDEDGLLYTMRKSKGDWADSLMKVAATYQATAKGQPVIYYGEEIGLTGANDWPIYTNRPDFDWTLQATQAADSNSMYNHYKKVLNIRRNYSEVFAKGTRTTVVPDSGDGYEVFSRSYEGKTLYVGVNVWGDARTTTFYVPGAAGTVYTDLYSGNTYTVKADGTLTITIPGARDGGTAILVGTGVVVNDTNEITVKIHYTRNDGNYTGWNLWAWKEGAGGAQYDFVQEGNDMVATVTGLPGRTTTRMGYHTRLNEWTEQDYSSDQWVDLSDVVSGTVHYYINSSSYGGTRVLGSDVVLGSKIVTTSYNRNTNVVTVNMSTPITGSALDAFKIMCTSTDTRIDIESVEKNGNQYFLTLKQDISSLEDLLLSYTISYDGYTYNLMTPNVYSTEEFEDAYTYTGNDLGLTYTSAASTFKLWAPTADSVTLNIYAGGTAGTDDKIASYPMTGGTKADKGVWTYTLNGDYNGKYYTYSVNVANKVNEACDPYARTTGVNGKRAMILNLASTNPAGWDADKNAKRHDGMNYTDAVIYELHVRDLSIDSSSGVDSKYQGKFLGLTQTGTTTAGGNPTALDHMIDLGITHLHLIPVYDYGSVDETKLDTPQFNWGYDPVNYNVPEGSYSTNPYDGSVRVKEMKQMIKTLHDNNINVVMDVVYNHVYDADSFAFNQAVPKYFSRTKEDGTYSSRSGCGNDTASERSMVHKYIVDSILYWHNEYHIDGFRFDLVGLIDTVTINKIVADVHAIDRDIIFYGEGWNMDDTVMSKDGYDLAKQDNAPKTPGFAYFSDNIRNGIAGSDVNGEGYIWGHSGKDTLVSGLTLARSGWTKDPSQVINYVSCHDNYTLFDKINVVSKAGITSYNYTPGDYQVALNNLAVATYMFSEGIPLVHAGEDMLRIKLDSTGKVIHNSYNSPDSVNKIRWSNLDTAIYKDTTDYYKGLIEFRKNHAVLRLPTEALVNANVTSTVHSRGVIINTFKGNSNYSQEVSDGIVTIFNASNNAVTISNNYGITSGTEWKVCVNKDNAGTEVLETITNGSVTVPAHSVMALVKGETVDTNSIYDQNNTVTLTVDKTTLTTGIGGVVAINATTNIPATLTWVSSNTNVATVDAQGRVTAVAEGSATITVSTYHGVQATCAVEVTDEAVTETITIDKTELSLVAGESDTLVITVSPVGTTAIFESTDESVATIDETGKVTAVAAGTATVKATLANGQSVSCTVTVEAAPEEIIIELNKDTMSLTEGDSEKLVAVVTPAGTTVTFSSKNTNVATVDQYGNVTAVAEGSAEIIVVASTGKTAICTVTVTKTEEDQDGSESDDVEIGPSPSEPTPAPNPVPSTPDSDASTGAGNGAAAGVNPGATTTTPTKPAPTTPATPDENENEIEVETKAETEVPETVEEVTPIVDEKLQNAIVNETEKILEDVLNDDISEEVMTEETLEKVKEALENGDSIITEIIVDKLDEADVKAEVKEAFEKVLAESFRDKEGAETKIAQYLDLSVLLKTTQGQELGAIHKLSKDMTFTIAVPEDLVKDGRIFVVLRMHEGETTVLETSMNADGTLSFKTDRFSEYALAYVDAEPEDAKDDTEGTDVDVPSEGTTTEDDGNNIGTFVVVGLIIAVIVAAVAIFFTLKRKKAN